MEKWSLNPNNQPIKQGINTQRRGEWTIAIKPLILLITYSLTRGGSKGNLPRIHLFQDKRSNKGKSTITFGARRGLAVVQTINSAERYNTYILTAAQSSQSNVIREEDIHLRLGVSPKLKEHRNIDINITPHDLRTTFDDHRDLWTTLDDRWSQATI